MKKTFDHIGIITIESQPDEFWVAESEVWVTNPRKHPQRIEYVRPKSFPEISPNDVGLWKLWHLPHVAYRVDNLQRAIEGEDVVLGPFRPGDFVEVAFIHKNGVILEYMEYSDLSHWFGQPNPDGFTFDELTE